MNNKQKIIVSVTGIFLVLLLLLGLTYGYFLTKINGNTNDTSISVKTANLALVYGDGNGVLEVGEVITPGNSIKFKTTSGDTVDSKTFTVTNEGNATTDYVVVIEVAKVINVSTGATTTFESNDFRYTLTCTTDGSIACSGVENEVFPMNGGIVVGNNIEVGKTHTYTLKMEYLETNKDQSADMNKSFTAKLNIKDISTLNPYSSDTSLLSYNIINNSVLGKNGTTLSAVPDTTPAVSISVETEKVLSITQDDYGTSYYYRGNVEDNYVEFNNMCWRIVRIEGDGSVKITLAAEKKCSEITDSDTGTAFIETGNYGYTKSSDKYIANYLTTSVNSMKPKLETWLEENGIDKTKLKEDNWCLGNRTDAYDNSGVLETSTVNDLMNSGATFYYDTNRRLYGKGTTRYATLKCSDDNYETFSSYIGALTADEVVFAGGKVGTSNADYYLIDNATSSVWWTLSLFYFNGDRDFAVDVRESGNLGSERVIIVSSLRPSIVLASGVKITSGDGTVKSPYKLL